MSDGKTNSNLTERILDDAAMALDGHIKEICDIILEENENAGEDIKD